QGHASLFFGIALQDWDERAGRPPSVNPRIVNNLVVGGGRCIEIRQLSELGGLVGLDGAPGSDYNAYPLDCGFVDQRTVAGRLVPRRLADWRLQSRADAHSVSGDFRVDASGRLAGGTAPGPGTAVAGLVDDITGAPRPGDMVIGAYGGAGRLAGGTAPGPGTAVAGLVDDITGAPRSGDMVIGAYAASGASGALAPPVEAAGRDDAGSSIAPVLAAPLPAAGATSRSPAAEVAREAVKAAAGPA